MPLLKTYDLFISHAWRYNDEYYRLVGMLNAANNFKYRNYSVPEHDPKIDPDSDAGKRNLLVGLDNQVRPVNCVLILAGMYAHYSYWINKEIELAQKYYKPIIGVIPWGQTNTPKVVQDAAIEMVRWNTDSIIDAIRRNSI
jgi:hypothetical protein